MKKVIILSARELGYQVIKALGEHDINSIVIYGHEKDEIGQHSKYVKQSYNIPHFFEKPDLLLNFLMDNMKEWQGMLVIPTEDYGVKFLSENKDELSRSYIIPTPSFNVISKIINKKSLYKFAEEMGVGVPKIFTPKSIHELTFLKNKLDFPCLLKPALGHLFAQKFDVKMLEIHNYDELLSHYKYFTNNFENDEFELMICEIIPGQDSKCMVQYVSYLDQSSDLLASMTSRKLRQDPPKYGQGRVIKSEKIGAVDELSLKLLKKLKYFGFSEIEWKLDLRDGNYKLIEVNPRFIFYIGLCVACGINFPYIQYLDMVKNKKIRQNSYTENVYWIHLYKDVLHTVLHHKMESFTIREYVAPYFKKKVFAVGNLNDPKPFYWQWKQHIGNMFHNLRREG